MSDIPRLVRSFGYAIQGLGRLFAGQPNARIHLVAAIGVSLLGLWLGLPASDWALLILTMGLVMAAEGFNTAIELAIDRIGPEPHPLSGQAKDLAAGAVLITAITAVGVGLLVLGPPLWARLQGF